MTDTELTAIWETATIATGFIADAIFAKGRNPKADVTRDLDEAAKRLSHAALEIRQLLAGRTKK